MLKSFSYLLNNLYIYVHNFIWIDPRIVQALSLGGG